MAASDGGRAGRPDVMVGLLTDPDLPAELAEQLAAQLPELLARRLDEQISWQIRVRCHRFDLAEEDRLLALAHDRRAREGWDLAVCLTDLPRRSGLRPIVAEADLTNGVALASLPALGPASCTRASGSWSSAWLPSWPRDRWGLAGSPSNLAAAPAPWPRARSGGWCRPTPASMCGSSFPGSAARPGC